MKRTLYLHIGVHRTATSSIQAYLQQNFHALLEQGFLLPWARGRHLRVVNRLFDGREKPAAVAKDIKKRADAKPKPIHSIILSDEDIAMRETLTPFVKMRRFFDVKIVVSLRRQDLWLESWYLQNIKWQWNDSLAHVSFDEFMSRMEEFHWIDYNRYLTMLERDFGRENVLVSVFERGQMPGGPIETFARLIGLDTENLSAPSHRNASFSPLVADFVRRMPLDLARPKLRALIEQSFIKLDAELEKSDVESSGLLLTKERRAAVCDRFAEGNRAVARRYFDRDALFSDPLPEADAVIAELALPTGSEELMTRIVEPVMRDLIPRLDELLEPKP